MWGQKSLDKIATCDERLQLVLYAAILHMDLQMVYGHRDKKAQTQAFESGHSKVQWPNSKHNAIPSKAFDVIPYPGGWPKEGHPDYHKHIAKFYYMGALIKVIAFSLGISLKWGGDWDGDVDFTDQTFDDLAHFELID